MIDTDIEWPKQLPNPLREGHALQPAQPFERTQMLNGRARNRRAFSSVPVNGTWSFIFDSPQAAWFERWFMDALNDGVNWFKIPRKTPLGIRMLVCRFTSMYSGPALVGVDRWKYDCPLEIYQRDMMDVEWTIIPEMWFGMDILDIAVNREWPQYESNS